jgi:hypothetical protein
MKNLQLSLETKWFEMTKAGIKTEDYRNITPYWCNRFLHYKSEPKSKKWWYEKLCNGEHSTEYLLNKLLSLGLVSFKDFPQNTMTLGYPKSTDENRIVRFEHDGIEIREGHPKWGATPGRIYFVIKHGKSINK